MYNAKIGSQDPFPVKKTRSSGRDRSAQTLAYLQPYAWAEKDREKQKSEGKKQRE